MFMILGKMFMGATMNPLLSNEQVEAINQINIMRALIDTNLTICPGCGCDPLEDQLCICDEYETQKNKLSLANFITAINNKLWH